MVPCIIIQFYTNDQQDATVWDNLLFPRSLVALQQDATVWDNLLITPSFVALHVSSDIITHHQEHLNCSYSF
jgi:hypothetical protein